MEERLVDVLDSNGTVLHTYPITLDETGPATSDAKFIAKALEAAAQGRLVPDGALAGLSARIHRSHGGQMQPYGDRVSTSSETKLGLEQAIRERAYFLWQEDGRPQGNAEEYWYRALDQHLRERAYVMWQQDGSPEGSADEHWRRIRDFQEH